MNGWMDCYKNTYIIIFKEMKLMNNVILQAQDIFKDCGFDYAVCGGYGLDMFVGKELRSHGDFDIVVYNDDKQRIVQFFMDRDWTVYGRFMEEGVPITQHLFYKIEDITDNYWRDCKNMWVIKKDGLPNVLHKLDRLQGGVGEVYTYQTRKWLVQDNIEFIELEIDAKAGNDFVVQENPRITRPLDKGILHRDGIPYLAPEIILFYKSDKFSSEHPSVRPKTEADFKTIMPLLSEEQKQWLMESIKTARGHETPWLDWLTSHCVEMMTFRFRGWV